MSLSELLPSLRGLSRADKWCAMQFLVQELAREEETRLAPDAEYPVWSPLNAFGAAGTLLDVLSTAGTTPDAKG
jgi:hypothetical protein